MIRACIIKFRSIMCAILVCCRFYAGIVLLSCFSEIGFVMVCVYSLYCGVCRCSDYLWGGHKFCCSVS